MQAIVQFVVGINRTGQFMKVELGIGNQRNVQKMHHIWNVHKEKQFL
jgi:hypothetical protein